MFRQCVLLLILGFIICSPCWPTETVNLYLYNTPPPLNTDMPGNLSDYLAKFLSDFSDGKYQFRAVYLPRKRLDSLVSAKQWHGAVIWANPAWFNDSDQERYLWSEKLATDYNLVLSHKKKPVEFVSPASLTGLKLGGVLGHIYSDFDVMIKDGRLTREDSGSFLQNLMKLKARRVDVIFIPASALYHFKQQYPDMDDWIYVAKKPRNIFHYRIFCSLTNKALVTFFDEGIKGLQLDWYWQNTMKAWMQHLELSR